MTNITRFEDIIVWQDSKSLAVSIYSSFKDIRDFGLRDQVQRAAVSVMNNIAEGFERETDREFVRFLYIAKASCGEVRSIIILSEEIGYLDKPTAQKLISHCLKLSGSIFNFIKYLRK